MIRELLYIPNLFTISRILLSPLVIVVFDSLLWLFVIGLYTGISDFFDGYFARKLDQSSELGAYLDPIADKLLVVMFLIAAITRDLLAPWMIAALLIRDAYTICAYVAYRFFFHKSLGSIEFGARFPGKLVTFIQFLCLAMLTLMPYHMWQEPAPLYHWRNWLFLSLYPLSFWAAIDYQRHYWRITHPK